MQDMLIRDITAALNNLASLSPANILHVPKCLLSCKILFSLLFLFCKLDQKVKFQEYNAALISYITLLCWIRKIEAHIDTSKYWNFIHENLNWNDFISHLEIKSDTTESKTKTTQRTSNMRNCSMKCRRKSYRKADDEQVAYQPGVQTSAQAVVSTPYSHSQFSSWFLARSSSWFWQYFK